MQGRAVKKGAVVVAPVRETLIGFDPVRRHHRPARCLWRRRARAYRHRVSVPGAAVRVGCFALLVAGCGGGESGASTGAGGGPAAAPVALRGTVLDITTFLGARGANVCVLDDSSDCTKTDAEGAFGLTTKPSDELAIHIVDDGMVHTIVPAPEGGGDAVLDVELFPQALLDGPIATSIGVTLDPKKGLLIVARTETGVSAKLTSGVGPFYVSGGMVDPTAKATFGTGSIAFVNVDPGTQELTLTHPTLQCDPPAWKGSGPGSARLPIVAGALTSVEVVPCY